MLRTFLALVLVFLAARQFFAPAMTFAYFSESAEWLARLEGFAPGDDHRNFIPAMEAVPFASHLAMIAAGVLYLVCAMLTLRERPPLMLFTAGVVAEMIGWSYGAVMPLEARAFPHTPSLLRDVLVPTAPPFVAIATLWYGARRNARA